MTQVIGGDGMGTTHGTRGLETTRTTTTELAQQTVPRDRVRWGPVLAGLFAALSTLAVLAVLGIAIGASTADYGDSPKAFGIGAGIWTIVSVLLAFLVGGFLSAYSAATPATHLGSHGKLKGDNAVLQGAMVWMVAIPLSIYMIAGGIGSALGVAGKTANAAVQASSNVAGPTAAEAGRQATDNAGSPGAAADQAKNAAQNAADTASQQVDQAKQAVQRTVTPENVDKATDYAAGSAWGVLVSLLVGLAASTIGGLIGGKARSSATVHYAH